MISSKDFFIALDLLEKERKIDKDYFISALESALTSAYKKNFGEAQSAEVKLNPEKNTIKVLAYKTVVEEVEDPEVEISLKDALKIDKTLIDVIVSIRPGKTCIGIDYSDEFMSIPVDKEFAIRNPFNLLLLRGFILNW